MIDFESLPQVKGLRVRKRGDGEGSIWKKGNVWMGRWVQWVGDVQKRPKKIIGTVRDFPSKREAREELNRIIREATGRVAAMPKAPTFAEVWERYRALNKPAWSKAHTVEPIMRRGVLPAIGDRDIATLTREPIQAALNHMAEVTLLLGSKQQHKRIGYGRSALVKARTYIKAVLEFALEEDLIAKNPARKLVLPATRKPSETVLSAEQAQILWDAATGREHVTLGLLIVAGLRPAELFALRTDDVFVGEVRIDEAVHNAEVEASGKRIGDTKNNESNSYVPISAALDTELRAWADMRPPGALLFPSEAGTTWRLGNYLKRVLRPIAESVGIKGLTFQCLRRTCATHFKGTVKDRQAHLRHANPSTTHKHYQKSIAAEHRAAVEELDAKLRLRKKVEDRTGRVN
jgi:integrase